MWGDGEEKTRRRSLPAGWGEPLGAAVPTLKLITAAAASQPGAHNTKGFSGARPPLPAPSCLVRPPGDMGPQ